MTYIEIEPELDACVETKAKTLYNQFAGKLLEKGQEEELTERLELLWHFLQTADFNKLRSESEKHLVEGRGVRFILYLEEGKPKYEMQVG